MLTHLVLFTLCLFQYISFTLVIQIWVKDRDVDLANLELPERQ